MRGIITQIADKWARVLIFDNAIEYSRNRDLIEPGDQRIYDLVYLSKAALILSHRPASLLFPELVAPTAEPHPCPTSNSRLQGSGQPTEIVEATSSSKGPGKPQWSRTDMDKLENDASPKDVSKQSVVAPSPTMSPPIYYDVPVVLSVTFFRGPLAGDVYYHHLLPPPPAWTPSPDLFKLGPTLLSAEGQQKNKDWLDMNIATVLLVGSKTLMAFYGISDEAGFGSGGWKGFTTDFDGELVNPYTTLRKLTNVFLETKPIPGTPLVITPVLPDDELVFGNELLEPLKPSLGQQRRITL